MYNFFTIIIYKEEFFFIFMCTKVLSLRLLSPLNLSTQLESEQKIFNNFLALLVILFFGNPLLNGRVFSFYVR